MNSQKLSAIQEAYLNVYNQPEALNEDYTPPTTPPPVPAEVRKSTKKPDITFKTGWETAKPMHGEYDNPDEFPTHSNSKKLPSIPPPVYSGPTKSSTKYVMSSSPKTSPSVKKEQTDLYDIILSHLLDEGYAETPEQAEVIMVNMSEDWRESICEGYKKFPYKKVEDKIHKKEADNPTGRGTPQSVKMDKVFRHFKGEVRRTERREHSPKISKAKEAENRARGTQKG